MRRTYLTIVAPRIRSLQGEPGKDLSRGAEVKAAMQPQSRRRAPRQQQRMFASPPNPSVCVMLGADAICVSVDSQVDRSMDKSALERRTTRIVPHHSRQDVAVAEQRRSRGTGAFARHPNRLSRCRKQCARALDCRSGMSAVPARAPRRHARPSSFLRIPCGAGYEAVGNVSGRIYPWAQARTDAPECPQIDDRRRRGIG